MTYNDPLQYMVKSQAEKPVISKYNPQWVVARLRGMMPRHLQVWISYGESTHDYTFSMTIPNLRDIREDPLTEQMKFQQETLELIAEDDDELGTLIGVALDRLASELLRRLTA